MTQRFPKSARLRTQFEFDAVYNGDAFAADDVLVIKAIRNGTEVTRLGLSVGKKVGNAVVRNHWKRRIREAFRIQRSDLPAGLDLVVRPKRGAACDYAPIHRSIGRLAQRLDKKLERDDRS
jgi:ribonuclease P protein component